MFDFIVIDYVLYIVDEKVEGMEFVLFGIVGFEIVFLFFYINLVLKEVMMLE